MRILIGVHGFPPAAQGGAEIYARAVARELARDPGDEVVVLAREARPELPEHSLREVSGEPFRLLLVNNTYRACRSTLDAYRHPGLSARLDALVDEVRPELAHLHHLTNLSTDLVDSLSRRRIPIVFTAHDYWLLCHRGQLLDRAYARCDGPSPAGCAGCMGLAAQAGRLPGAAQTLLRRLPDRLAHGLARAARRGSAALGEPLAASPRALATAEERNRRVREAALRVSLLLAPSRTLRDRCAGFGIPPDRIALHPYGHDHAPFRELRRSASAQLRIGFIGSLMASKAPHLVLEAFAALPACSAELRLHGRYSAYHGDDGYRRILEPLLEQPGVRWMGEIDHAAIPAALAGIDVLVVPSIWLENAPLSISEAFLAGVPVVCSDLGGMAEMVEHERSGLRFRPGDSADLRRALVRLLDEPGLLERLRRGIPPVRSLEDDVAELRAHYARLTSAPRDGGSVGSCGRRPPPRLAAVVVNHRTAPRTLACARSVLGSHRGVDLLIVVDNGSGDGSAERIEAELGQATLVRCARNLGFAAGANAGMRLALEDGAELVLLVNSDARLDAECIGRLEGAVLADPGIGLAGPVILDAALPERIESAGLVFSRRSGRFRERASGRAASGLGPSRGVDALSGCAVLIRREALDAVGLLDEAYFFGFEDVDFCLRARRAGFRSECVPEARAWHEGQATIGRRSPERLYYAARNHLRVARRAAPASGPLHTALREAAIAALNVAHALRGSEVARLPGLLAVLRGCYDHARRRYGAAPAPLTRRGARRAGPRAERRAPGRRGRRPGTRAPG